MSKRHKEWSAADRKLVRELARILKDVDSWCCENCRVNAKPAPHHYRMAIAAIRHFRMLGVLPGKDAS